MNQILINFINYYLKYRFIINHPYPHPKQIEDGLKINFH